MILLDGDDERDKIDPQYFGPTIRHPEEATLRPVPSLPDYDTSQQEHAVLKEGGTRRRRKRHCDSKLFRATLYAFAIYVAISLAVVTPVVVIRSRNKARVWKNVPSYALWSPNDASDTLPLQTLRDSLSPNEVRCNVWDTTETSTSNPLLLSTTHYNLSAQGLITIRSNVSYSADTFSGINGSLTVQMNKNTKETDVVFSLDLFSSTTKLRDQTNVCFTNAGTSRGLTIYVPSYLDAEDALSFSIEVLLPASSNIDTFITYLPLFTQSYGNLSEALWFNQIFIEGTDNPISCKGLGGSQISVKNALDAIHGSFNATNSLTLDTVRGSIAANIVLTQLPSSLEPSFLSLDTGYSSINANVTLSTILPSDSFTPSFVTQVKTFNGAINLDISHAQNTPPSELNLQVQNALAQSNVRLDSKFQGLFSVQTKLDQVLVRNSTSGSKSSDPANVRTVQYDQKSSGKAAGWVGMGARPPVNGPQAANQGRVDIVSSLSPITLDLG